MPAGMREYKFDDVIVEPEAFRVQKSGRVVALEPKSIRLLLYLIENRSRAVSKEELLHELWHDVPVTDNALTRVVAQLRRALGDDAKEAHCIETIPTFGYRFVADVIVLPKGAEGHSIREPARTFDGVSPPPASPARVVADRSAPILQRTSFKVAASIGLALAGMIVGVTWERRQSPARSAWSGSLLDGPVIASHPRLSPDGQTLAFRGIVNGQSQVGIMKPDTGSWTMLTHEPNLGPIGPVAWARDAKTIYFARYTGSWTVYSIGPLGGEPRIVLTNAYCPEPLPDGSMIVSRPSSQGRQQLFRFWPDSGRLQPLPATVLFSDTRTVSAFPDGKEIAVLGFHGSDDGVRSLFVLDLATHKTRDLWTPDNFVRRNDWVGSLSRHAETTAVSADGRTVLTSWNQHDSVLVSAVARDGSRRHRTLLSFPLGATPLAFDAAPDGSLYLDQSARTSAVLRIGAAGKIISEMPLPMDAVGVVPLPNRSFVFTLSRAGRSHLLWAAAGAEPRAFLNTSESARLPAAWLGGDRLAFVIGGVDDTRLAIGAIEGGQVFRRFQANARQITSIAASPDGGTIYYAAEGDIWAQPVSGGNLRKLGSGYQVAADPSSGILYLTRFGTNGPELWSMPAGGGEPEKVDLPAGYALMPQLSSAAVHRDGRILLQVATRDEFFVHAAILDPARRHISLVPTPPGVVVNSAAWDTTDGSVNVQITRWSSTLWHYRPLSKNAVGN